MVISPKDVPLADGVGCSSEIGTPLLVKFKIFLILLGLEGSLESKCFGCGLAKIQYQF